ncbi:MAG: hypothetical protein DRQ88_05720 [Epsilonproteobacteria bacterium]|nr:MAG: hypothetical protein DRQ89_07045 [Campylobacterota bacterium]RLA66711.1 MAG: hypothetical protein DRQ88_05720 [Campylobacterota bacterium]
MVKVAVIGFGHLGKWHAEKAASLAKEMNISLTAIVEKYPSAREKAANLYPGITITPDLSDIIDLVDAAIVVTPTSTHSSVIKELLKKNKHVFCEKPLTPTYEEALEIENLAKDKGLIFQVGHSERFHQSWEMVDEFKEIFDTPGVVTINRLGAFKGRATDVDVVNDLMVHDLDILLHLFGEYPETITSNGYKILTDNFDYVKTRLGFKSGRVATITSSRNHIEEVRTFELTNDKGTIVIDLLNNEIKHANKSGKVEVIKYNKRDHLLLEQESFYQAILTGSKVPVTLKDGVMAVKLVGEVLESL